MCNYLSALTISAKCWLTFHLQYPGMDFTVIFPLVASLIGPRILCTPILKHTDMELLHSGQHRRWANVIVDPRLAARAAVHPRLLPAGRRREGPVRGHPRALHLLCGSQVCADTFKGGPTLGAG